MSLIKSDEVLSHWNTMVEGLQQSTTEFYTQASFNLGTHGLKGVQIEGVTLPEGGIFSARRSYLQIEYRDFVYHVCAAPYGNDFFVSSWLCQKPHGFILWLASLPYIGVVFQILFGLIIALFIPTTYYKIDTAQMFHSVVHSAVTKALDKVIAQRGLRPLSDADRKPIMKDVLALMR